MRELETTRHDPSRTFLAIPPEPEGRQNGLAHVDLGSEHILRDSENKQVNVIDFSDWMIGDHALDSAGVVGYGREVTERVFERYRGLKDDGMLRRAQLSFKGKRLETMVDSLLGYPCTFEEFGQRFEP